MRRVAGWRWMPLLVGLLVVVLLNWWTPDPEVDHRISWVEGELGTPTSTSRLTVRVSDVQFGRELSTSDYDEETVRTEHVLVAVAVEVDVREQLSNLLSISLHTRDGRYYEPRPENEANLDQAAPGYTSTGTPVFLVPADRLEGARLRLTPSTRLPINHDSGVSIDLRITDRDAAVAEADAAGVLDPPAPSVVVT
ncbi:DUF4352 domain-containing protein [Auraticoccus monumenti]|uniref:DUF4352 domain-containing protein n=1 Tax=Auraticoccus monumenti TaxID=675864 RepID=A0A1G6ZWD6_9ACTN|nr:hypothetical protein [Auraticoccus monumenti]SDE06145.1 hypothetical protein SAMN04489747_2403 [Auraticoccus monumenti]